MIELTHVTALVSAGVALWSLIRVEQVHRASGTEELHKKIEASVEMLNKKIDLGEAILRGKLEMLALEQAVQAVRLKPWFDTADKRIAEMLHQPHPSKWRLDRLVEEYRRDAEWMSPQRVQDIISEVELIKHQSSKEGDEPNPFTYLLATFSLAFMDGRRDAKHLMDMHEDRLRELQARQVILEAERQALQVEDSPPVVAEEEIPWWRPLWMRFKAFLGRYR